MTDPVLPATISSEYNALENRISILERTSRMPPVVPDGWAPNVSTNVNAGWTLVGRKVILAPSYSVVQAEGFIQTGVGSVAQVFMRENFASPTVDTSVAVVGANAAGIVRFTWALPYPVGWEGHPIELQWWARRLSGSTDVLAWHPWLLTFAGPSYLAGQADGKPQFIPSAQPPAPPPPPPPPPPTPTTRSVQFGPTWMGAWRPQGGWVKPNPYQGSWSGWGPYSGMVLYDWNAIRAEIAGRTVNSADLLVYRDSGGVYGAQPLYVGYVTDTGPAGQPNMGAIRHVGSLAVGQLAWLPLGVDLIEWIRSGATGLGCYGSAYFSSTDWTLQITSTG